MAQSKIEKRPLERQGTPPRVVNIETLPLEKAVEYALDDAKQAVAVFSKPEFVKKLSNDDVRFILAGYSGNKPGHDTAVNAILSATSQRFASKELSKLASGNSYAAMFFAADPKLRAKVPSADWVQIVRLNDKVARYVLNERTWDIAGRVSASDWIGLVEKNPDLASPLYARYGHQQPPPSFSFGLLSRPKFSLPQWKEIIEVSGTAGAGILKGKGDSFKAKDLLDIAASNPETHTLLQAAVTSGFAKKLGPDQQEELTVIMQGAVISSLDRVEPEHKGVVAPTPTPAG